MKKVILGLIALAAVAGADELQKLNISGMTCPACVKNVKESMKTVNGVKDATVYLKEGRAEVKTADGTNPEAICNAVKQAGYGCKVAK